MIQIENFLLQELCFYVSYLNNIRILPGVNLLDDSTYSNLLEHPSFKDYVKRGVLAEVNIDADEYEIDEETNITILKSSDEKVPIQNVTNRGGTEALAQKGIVISMPQAKKAGLNDEIAGRLINYMPANGWVSEKQIREKLQLDEKIDLSLLPFNKKK